MGSGLVEDDRYRERQAYLDLPVILVARCEVVEVLSMSGKSEGIVVFELEEVEKR